MGLGTIITLAVLVIIAVYAITLYNGLVQIKHNVAKAWANIDVLLKQRHDELPKLIETCKQYMKFEQDTLTKVIEARSKATSVQVNADDLTPERIAAFQKAQGELKGALSRLLVTVERYPDLKANQNFLALQSQLEGTENRINVERDRFNEQVRGFNSAVKRIPTSIIASIGGFESRGYFEAEAEAQAAPEVSFE